PTGAALEPGRAVLARPGWWLGGRGKRGGPPWPPIDAMRALRIPSWLSAGVLERYHAGASHLFLLHGNVRDLQPFGEGWVALTEGLKLLTRRREVVVTYDVSSGLAFPDAEREKALRKVLGLKGPLPADPARALVVLDALLTTERCPARSV